MLFNHFIYHRDTLTKIRLRKEFVQNISCKKECLFVNECQGRRYRHASRRKSERKKWGSYQENGWLACTFLLLWEEREIFY